jgi:hypothetical protein
MKYMMEVSGFGMLLGRAVRAQRARCTSMLDALKCLRAGRSAKVSKLVYLA